MTEQTKKVDPESGPPANATSILAWDDCVPTPKKDTVTLISPEGDERTITLTKGNLRILRTMQRSPVYCASPVRISDRVLILKRDYGVNIRTDMYAAKGGTECERFGVYTLLDTVHPVKGGAN